MSGWLTIIVEGNESRGYLDVFEGMVVGCSVEYKNQLYGLVFLSIVFSRFRGLVYKWVCKKVWDFRKTNFWFERCQVT